MPKTKHGMHKSAVYLRWVYMKSRCRIDEKYIKNGIKVCERWQSFENFYSDMGDLPSEDHTLDRKDGSKDYSPENCRWATYKEQNRNLKSNVWVGDKIVADIVKETGLSHTAISYRVANGLDPYEVSQKDRTHCREGHEWTEENTYITEVKRKQGGTRMQRFCRECRKKAAQDFRDRKMGIVERIYESSKE